MLLFITTGSSPFSLVLTEKTTSNEYLAIDSRKSFNEKTVWLREQCCFLIETCIQKLNKPNCKQQLDWLLIVASIWLVWNTYIACPPMEETHSPTRRLRYIFRKKITQILILETIPKQRHGLLICILVIDVTWQTDFINITGLVGRRKQISITKHTAVKCIWNFAGCSAMFHVPGFINFQKPDKFYYKLKAA